MTIPGYPLQWPVGWKRLGAGKSASFTTYKRQLSIHDGVNRVRRELERFGIPDYNVVISTNVPLRLDGFPRSDRSEPADPGAAVYWEDSGNRRVMAIDLYNRVADNLAAIAATLEAMRAIERHGGATVLERAFTGFIALPAPAAERSWREVLGVLPMETSRDQVRDAYRRRAAESHPDRAGGSHVRMAEVNRAWEQAQEELG